jgi:hypothetical protein
LSTLVLLHSPLCIGADRYNHCYNRHNRDRGRDGNDAPAVNTATSVMRNCCHVRRSSYRARLPWQARQAEQALPRLPAHRPPHGVLVQEDQGQNPLLRSVE